MKGIYISVPDNEFSFYMAVLERFKTAVVLRTEEIKTSEMSQGLLPWQIKELDEILKEEENAPSGIDAKLFLNQLRGELDV